MGRALKGQGTERSLEAWAKKREPWIADGNRILEALHTVLSSRILDDATLFTPSMRNLWNLMCDVVLSVTYMISAVQARIDFVLYRDQWLLPNTSDKFYPSIEPTDPESETQTTAEEGSETEGSEWETEGEMGDHGEDWI